MARDAALLDSLRRHRETWDRVETIDLDEKTKEYFESHKKAVDYYIDGYLLSDIERETGVRAGNIRYFVERCLTVDQNGKEYGYAALLPNVNIREKTQRIEGELYQFRDLLRRYPILEEKIRNNLIGKNNVHLSKRMSIKAVHSAFIADCKKLGILDQEYPLNQANQAKSSIYKYCQKLLRGDVAAMSSRVDRDAAQKLKGTGIGEVMTTRPIYPYSSIQIDGHKLDVLFTTEVIENGVPVTKLCDRCYLLVAISTSARAALGFSLTAYNGYSRIDVLKCIQNVIMPKEKMEYTIDGLVCPENGGFPDTAFPELEFALPNSIMFDNALAHLAVDVLDSLQEIGIVANFGPVAQPGRRGIVERFFETLEESGLHDLAVTTGSGPRDPRRRKDAERLAIRYKFDLHKVEQIIDYLIRTYNNSLHSSINESPIANVYRNTLQAGAMPAIAYGRTLESVQKLTWYYDERVIRGSHENGVRPYLQYKGVRYSSDLIGGNLSFVGQRVRLHVDPENSSVIDVYSMNGRFIDTVRARGIWEGYECSYFMRDICRQYLKDNDVQTTSGSDLPMKAMESMFASAKNKRAAASKIARAYRESDLKERIERGEIQNADDHVSKDPDEVTAMEPLSRREKAEVMMDMNILSAEAFLKKYKDKM